MYRYPYVGCVRATCRFRPDRETSTPSPPTVIVKGAWTRNRAEIINHVLLSIYQKELSRFCAGASFPLIIIREQREHARAARPTENRVKRDA